MKDNRVGTLRAVGYFTNCFDRWTCYSDRGSVLLAERMLRKFQKMPDYTGGEIELFVSTKIGWAVYGP